MKKKRSRVKVLKKNQVSESPINESEQTLPIGTPTPLDLTKLIKTGEEELVVEKPVESPSAPKKVITEQKRVLSQDVWEKTSSFKLPSDIEIVNVNVHGGKTGLTQIIIVIQSGRVAGVNAIRIDG